MTPTTTSILFKNGLHAEWSNVNRAWLVMWCDQVLGIVQTEREAVERIQKLLAVDQTKEVSS